MDCVFCNIVSKTVDAEILHESDQVVVIRDILPKAPVHLLIIPKKHIVSMNHVEESDKALLGEMLYTAKMMGQQHGVGDSGYKLIFNVGKDGGMVIPHLHLHLIGGKMLGE
jgi:histidine triad (HIT) family protein